MKLFYGVFFVLYLFNNFMLQCDCVLSHKDQELQIIAAATGNTSAISHLIANGVNISAHDNHGMTSLHFAVENGHYDAAKLLIKIGANIDAKDFFFNTPLHIACSKNYLKLMKLLIAFGADFTAVNLARHSPLSLSTVGDMVKPLLMKMRKKGRNFIDAVKKGNIQLAQQFIDQHVNINIRYTGISAIIEAIRSDQKEVVEWLIQKGIRDHKSLFGPSLREKAAAKGMNIPEGIEIDRASIIKEAEKNIHMWLQENPPQEEIEKLQKQNGHALTFQAYHRLDDIYSFLKYLTEKHGNLCKLFTIGKSYEGRPLKVLRISNGNPKNKAIWIDGGIHAREWISPAAVSYIANDLVKNWNNQPTHVQNINWYILVVHNPDGYEYSHQHGNRFWRKNRNPNARSKCAGVDLNRNYGHRWGGAGCEDDPCDEEYGGTHAFSEPESEAVRRFFNETDEDFHGFLTFHSYGQYILYPTYENMTQEHFEILCRVGQEAVQQMKTIDNQTYTMGCDISQFSEMSGSAEDWAASIGIKFAYTIELRDRGRYSFILPANQIESTSKEAQAFVRTISKAIFDDVEKNKVKKD